MVEIWLTARQTKIDTTNTYRIASSVKFETCTVQENVVLLECVVTVGGTKCSVIKACLVSIGCRKQGPFMTEVRKKIQGG